MIEYGELPFKIVRLEPRWAGGNRPRGQLRNLQGRIRQGAVRVPHTAHRARPRRSRDLQVEGGPNVGEIARRALCRPMCGRVIQSSGPLRYAIVDGLNVRDSRVHNYPPRWNGAPSQELLVIRRNHKTEEVSLDSLRWGLIPYWCKDPTGGRKPIDAKCETVGTLPTFRDAYRLRRCILPVDGFFEWKAIKGQRAKQPYAIAMNDGSPFGIGGLWENWKEPKSGEWIRTFALITTNANELVAEIHDRMPAILAPEGYTRWLSDEPDPRELMQPFPAGLMRMWPISTRVNKPENDDPTIIEPIELASDAA